MLADDLDGGTTGYLIEHALDEAVAAIHAEALFQRACHRLQ
jgi:hypothetical protein